MNRKFISCTVCITHTYIEQNGIKKVFFRLENHTLFAAHTGKTGKWYRANAEKTEIKTSHIQSHHKGIYPYLIYRLFENRNEARVCGDAYKFEVLHIPAMCMGCLQICSMFESIQLHKKQVIVTAIHSIESLMTTRDYDDNGTSNGNDDDDERYFAIERVHLGNFA